ncbi:MAG: TIGR04282 family arsenosugar biosynthesis glycosyltransferase [Gammaproteobacteria bacterium]|nr:TIGR04282 family arsenosugar biosynthesis glycosyltransferase [Gammaproteobacteria bacterium]
MKRPDLFIMAKQPVAGQVKTRLAQTCGAERAAEIAAALIRATLALVTENWPGEVYLCGAPDAGHPLFERLAAELHVHLASQGRGDLGERMHRLLRQGIERRGAAAVMGCDVPQCCASTLEVAYETLARGGGVIGPAMDGGYYFIGLQRAEPALFAGIDWGGDRVYAETRERARRAGIGFEVLAPLRDIDTWDDLVGVARDHPSLQPLVTGYPPATFPRPRQGLF